MFTDEHRRKISESHLGERNPMYGRKGKDHPQFRYTDEFLLDKLREVTQGQTIKVTDIDNTFRMQITRRFGSFSNALQKIGVTPNPSHGPEKYTKEVIVDMLRESAVDGFAPTQKEKNALVKLAIYRFGSYSKAVKEAGLLHRSKGKPGELNPAWKGGYKDYYGLNWGKQRVMARQRDGFKCRICGKTEENLGQQMDVHHIKPFREFGYIPSVNDFYLLANKLENLICYCNVCHVRQEVR